MKNTKLIALIVLPIIFASCASPETLTSCVEPSNQQGFLHGILHGFIAPITFLISFFSDNVTMYAVNNSGNWYDLGFLLGIGGFSSGILKSRKKKK